MASIRASKPNNCKRVNAEEAQRRLIKNELPLTIKQWGGSTNSNSVFVDHDYGEFTAKYSHAISGHTKHPSRKRDARISQIGAEAQLLKAPNNITLVTWGGNASNLSVFMDPEYGEFSGKLTGVVRGTNMHPERGKLNRKTKGENLKLGEEEATIRLAKTMQHLQIKHWGGSATASSIFTDLEFGEFEGKYSVISTGAKVHPKRKEVINASRIASSKLSLTEAKQRLLKFNEPVTILEWGGSLLSKSTFLHDGIETRTSLHSFLRRKEAGKQLQSKSSKKLWTQQAYKEKVKEGSKHIDYERVLEQRKQTMLKVYNVEHALQDPQILEKFRTTNLRRHGSEHYMQTEKGKEHISTLSLESGRTHMFDGKTMQELAKTYGKAYTTIQAQIKKYGFEYLDKVKRQGQCQLNLLETKMLNALQLEEWEIKNQVTIGKFRPDFLINNKVIVDIDGLFWHSDFILKDKAHALRRKNFLEAKGFKVLIFREDEVHNQLPIVLSIIRHNLGLSTQRVYARNTEIREISAKEATQLLEQWHLMGAGTGRTFTLQHNGQVVAIIRIKKRGKGLEVSRFACKPNVAIVGGFSKLIKQIRREMPDLPILTFIDQRYGSGNYLKTLGFIKKPTHQSFKWTNGSKCKHRMAYKGNSGYTAGFHKIWDCGQTPWVLP